MTRMPIRVKYSSPLNAEDGFTLIEMIMVVVLLSILGIFIFEVLTRSLNAQIKMQNRKERSDDAVLVLDKISREVREAKTINSAGSNTLTFTKNVTSSADANTVVKFILNTSANILMRQSASSVGALPGNSTSGSIAAENVSIFSVSLDASNRVVIGLDFSGGSEWETKIYPRNYGL